MNILDLKWPERLNLNYCDLHLQAKFNNKTYEGHGTSDDFDTAMQIAFVECLERFVRELKDLETTNGLAGHISLEKAIRSSKNELIERHIFLKHFKSQSKFPRTNKYKTNERINSITSYLKSKNMEIVISIIDVNSAESFCLVTLLGFSSERKFGMILGSAFSDSEEYSIEKALIEALRFYIYVVDNPDYSDYDENEFLSLDKPNFEDHGRLALNLEYARWFKNTFIGEDERSNIDINEEINIDVYDSVINDDVPVKFVRASSSSLHNLYVGKQSDDLKPHPFR